MKEPDLMSKARAGDHHAFADLTLPHHRELEVHCYRMLGSLQDAEDALQETLLAAWHSLPNFEERASLRTWLYRIATNRCLDARRTARRRPAKAWDVPGVAPLEPTGLEEAVWLEPYPDARLPEGAGLPLAPEARYDQIESISLAFITALQLLPPRQLSVLVLRDVLGFPARQVAEMLDTTVESVTSALKRARAGVQRQAVPDHQHAPHPVARSTAEQALVERFVSAWEAADPEGVVALLTDDAFVTMPPMPYRYDGRALVGRFCAGLFDGGRRFDLVPTRANGQPAVGAYLATATGDRPGVGLFVLTLTGDRILAMTRFEHDVLRSFGLPDALPARK
ncbi:MAG: polymerase, sigma-24 subunit, subfamily [Acidimicrobiales bacterium]|nr:polymerase, sigma-24 subunit, subfamily [Acidimicrobiales bacterium]